MKILLFNQTLQILAGSETYTLTLAAELKRLGHEVTAYSPHLGIIAAKLEGMGIKCVNELVGEGTAQVRPFSPILEEAEDKFDVAIGAHYDRTREVRKKFPNIPIIAICHGILHGNPSTGEIYPEHPVTDMRVEQYVSVSEEVQQMLKSVYGIDSVLIRNFFDLERFKKSGDLPEKPQTIMVSSNYWGVEDEINKIIKEVADHYGARFIGVGANFATTYETDEVIKQADVVFGMGRSVMEGFCAGKIAVVHGRWGTGGLIRASNYESLRKTNFSGRKFVENIAQERIEDLINPLLSSEEIIKQIDNYWSNTWVDENIEIAQEEHDVKKAAQKFLDIANLLIK